MKKIALVLALSEQCGTTVRRLIARSNDPQISSKTAQPVPLL